MSSDINRVILIGRLTRSPEMKTTNSGLTFCRFPLASNRSVYNRQTGESRDEVGFFDCVAWGKSGETIHKYLDKGRRICVEGNLRWSSWEGSDGKKASKVEINVEGFQFLDPKGGSQDEQKPEAVYYDNRASDDSIPF